MQNDEHAKQDKGAGQAGGAAGSDDAKEFEAWGESVLDKFDAPKTVERTVDVSLDGTPIVDRQVEVSRDGRSRFSQTVRPVRRAEGCGCMILDIKDFVTCPLGHFYCRTVAGHAVQCAACKHTFGCNDMTAVGEGSYCPRCVGAARRKHFFSKLWHGLRSILEAMGR